VYLKLLEWRREKKEALACFEDSRSFHLGHLIYIYDRTRGIVAADIMDLAFSKLGVRGKRLATEGAES
jgi:hypothetical protein